MGGARPVDRPRGYFYQPTVVADVQPSMPVYQEEIFGPVMPVASFDDVDEAVALAQELYDSRDFTRSANSVPAAARRN